MYTVLRKNIDKMESSGERRKREEQRKSLYSIVNRGCVKGIRRQDWNMGCRKEESESIGLAEAKERR